MFIFETQCSMPSTIISLSHRIHNFMDANALNCIIFPTCKEPSVKHSSNKNK